MTQQAAARCNGAHEQKTPIKFRPSLYQQAVFDALLDTNRDIQINAVAGSGKTSTIVEALKLLPGSTRKDSLLVAFNREIAAELETRAPLGVTVKTNHAVGNSDLAIHFQKLTGRPWKPKISDSKYRQLIASYWIKNHRKESDPPLEEEAEMLSLLHFVRVTLTDYTDRDALTRLVQEREITLSNLPRLATALPAIIRAGMDVLGKDRHPELSTPPTPNTIDFTDMLYLPLALKVKPRQYAIVMADEAQDLSAVQLQLLLSKRRPGGRMVFSGDPRQAIYGFCGADLSSWQNIARSTNALELPLSICYRCPKKVVALAREIVPDIEAGESAADGVVETISHEQFEQMVGPEDMVLCRVNAPLISAAFRLITDGKPAKMKGRDIGAQLLKLIDTITKTPQFEFNSFIIHCEAYRNVSERLLKQKDDSEMQIANLHDRIDSVEAVYTGATTAGATSINDLTQWIQRLFEADENEHVILSSIHRAKGLESDRVFIIRPDQMPHPMAQSESALVQEDNLRYVAITRAMKELYFVRPAGTSDTEQTVSETAVIDLTKEAGLADMNPASNACPQTLTLKERQARNRAIYLQLQERIQNAVEQKIETDLRWAQYLEEANRHRAQILQRTDQFRKP